MHNYAVAAVVLHIADLFQKIQNGVLSGRESEAKANRKRRYDAKRRLHGRAARRCITSLFDPKPHRGWGRATLSQAKARTAPRWWTCRWGATGCVLQNAGHVSPRPADDPASQYGGHAALWRAPRAPRAAMPAAEPAFRTAADLISRVRDSSLATPGIYASNPGRAQHRRTLDGDIEAQAVGFRQILPVASEMVASARHVL